MGVAYEVLRRLNTAPALFPSLGIMLRGAMTDVRFERDGEVRERTHLIIDTARFPEVRIAVQGSSSQPQHRQFFALPKIYRSVSWDLAQEEDEAEIATWAREHIEQEDVRHRAALAERQRLEAMWAAEEAARRTAEEQARARERLKQAAAKVYELRGWQGIVRDLNLVLSELEREADRRFIASLAEVQGRFGGFRVTEARIAWVSDVLRRALRRFELFSGE